MRPTKSAVADLAARTVPRLQCWSLVHSFQQVFEVVEAALPEAGHLVCPVDQRGQGAELRAIMRLATFVTVAHQSSLSQDCEMFCDGRLRDSGSSRQGSDRLFAFAAQSLEQCAPGRIGERSEQHIVSVRHLGSITCRLLIDI